MAEIGSAYLNTYCLQRPTLPPLAPEFSVVAMLLFVIFGNVYPREVRAIVCWYRLGMHSPSPRGMATDVLTTIRNCQAGSSGRAGAASLCRFCVSTGSG